MCRSTKFSVPTVSSRAHANPQPNNARNLDRPACPSALPCYIQSSDIHEARRCYLSCRGARDIYIALFGCLLGTPLSSKNKIFDLHFQSTEAQLERILYYDAASGGLNCRDEIYRTLFFSELAGARMWSTNRSALEKCARDRDMSTHHVGIYFTPRIHSAIEPYCP